MTRPLPPSPSPASVKSPAASSASLQRMGGGPESTPVSVLLPPPESVGALGLVSAPESAAAAGVALSSLQAERTASTEGNAIARNPTQAKGRSRMLLFLEGIA